MSSVNKLTQEQTAALRRALTLKEEANLQSRSEHLFWVQSSCPERISRLYLLSEVSLQVESSWRLSSCRPVRVTYSNQTCFPTSGTLTLM